MHALAMLFPRRFTVVPSWIMEDEAMRILWGVHRWYYLNFLALRRDMWSSMRFVPRAQLFSEVPFDTRCEARPGISLRLARTWGDWKDWVRNLQSEIFHRLGKILDSGSRVDEVNEAKSLFKHAVQTAGLEYVDIWST